MRRSGTSDRHIKMILLNLMQDGIELLPAEMLDIDQLTAAFLKARDELPDSHERKQRLARVTSLRYDRKTPNLVHLISDHPLDARLYRRVTKTTLEEAAMEMLLFPKHSVYTIEVTEEVRVKLLNLPQGKREKYRILDILEVDDQPHVMVLAPGGRVPIIQLHWYIAKSSFVDEEEKIVAAIVTILTKWLAEVPMTPVDLETLEPQLPELKLPLKYENALKNRLQSSDSMASKLNEELGKVLETCPTFTEDEIREVKKEVLLATESGEIPPVALQHTVLQIVSSHVLVTFARYLERVFPGALDRSLLKRFLSLPRD